MTYIEVAVKSPLRQTFTYSIEAGKAVRRGMRVWVSFGRREVIAVVINADAEKPQNFEVKAVLKVIDEAPLLTEELLNLAERLADYSFASLGEVIFAIMPASSSEKERGFAADDIAGQAVPAAQLTEEQQRAVSFIEESHNKYFYLFGVTGSGKTEVFFQLIRRALERGESVIYLVPEISLSQQIGQRAKSSFPEPPVIINSAQSPNRRLKNWRLMLEGKIRFVVGTRSAVFAPLAHIGLIIIDEEHDSSYKSSSTPRYHARQVAMMRLYGNAKLVMGSATPSLEAYEAMSSGTFTRLDLKKRVTEGATLPQVEVIDMRHEKGVLSRRLISEIMLTKEMGRQSLLFLNRKGFAHYYSCPDCGFELTCRHCSVALTYHKKQEKLLCHYCGYQQEPPRRCPSCGSFNAGYNAFGLEKVEDEVLRLFSSYKILRLDSETAGRKGEAQRIIGEFSEGRADILLGTQIIAKGFNFPKLRLVGLPIADVGLGMPDFRAEERTFALLSQIAGRAGRFKEKGLVIAQSYRPDNAALKFASRHQTEEFYKNELAVRKLTGFPPYSRLVKLVFRSKNEQQAIKAADQFAEAFAQYVEADDEILGPSEAPVKRTAGVYRYQVILKTFRYGRLSKKLRHYFEHNKTLSNVYCEVENDPVSLL
jgi:primosomal protein N' (replication factor Y)